MFTLLAALFSLAVIFLFVGVFYIVNAYGIMKLMQVKGYEQTFKAWVPFLNMYCLGEILEEELKGNQLVIPEYTKWILALYPIASSIPAVGGFASFAGYVYAVVLCCVMAQKYGTTASMVISSIFCLSGIGYSIVATKMRENGFVEPDFAGRTANKEPRVTVVDFEVHPADEASKPEPSSAFAEAAAAAVAAEMAAEEQPVVEVVAEPVEETEVEFVCEPDMDGGELEFEVPLGEPESDIIEIEVEE
ncbi:MAG: hypothetical protein PUD55_05080 [Firmicutes bacterium]|nr:hypothetical protein [Bacillota bacterium]